MHPILTNGKQMGLYLLGYLPIGAVLMIGFGHQDAWGKAAAFFLPLALLYAFIGMIAYYVCRAFPIGREYRFWRALPAQLTAALTMGGMSVGIAWAWAAALRSLNIGADPKLYLEQPWALFAVGALLFCLAIAFNYVLIAASETEHAESRALESDLLVREAELRALRAQLNPHFLFNSLNSVSSLTASDPSAARQMCLLLADFLRDTLRLGSAQRITVQDEFTVLQRYLAIEQVRRAVQQMFALRKANILPLTPAITQRATELMTTLSLSHGLQSGDALIAGTALEHQLRVLTGNTKHFIPTTGLEIEKFSTSRE